MKRWKVIIIALLTVTMALLSGCWDYREVENLYIVGGIAIDKGIQGHQYHMTFEVLDLSGGAQSSSMKGKILESEGDTIADAVSAVTKSADKTMYFSDCKIVVLSKDLAAEGLTPIFDWLNRDPEPRFTLQLFISEEKTASEILQGNGKSQDVVSFNISKLAEQSYATWGKYAPIRLYEADSVLWGQGKDLTIPGIRVNTQQNGKEVELYGTAVFRGDKLIAMLDEEQSQYFLFATDNVQGGLLLTGETPDSMDMSLRIRRSSTSIISVISGDQIAMNLNINMKASFDEENTSKSYGLYGMNQIEKFAEKTLEQRVTDTISFVQNECDSDIFGFGEKVYKKDPGLWDKIKPNWYSRFRGLKCNVSAKVEIVNTGFAYPKGHD